MFTAPLNRARPRESERGTVLLITMMLLTLLIVLVADAGSVATLEWEATVNADIDLQLEYALRGGLEIAKAYLVEDADKAGDIDTKLEEWAAPEGIQKEFDADAASASAGLGSSSPSDRQPSHPTVRIRIEDEESKWPLPLLLVGQDTQKERRKQGLANLIDSFRNNTALDIDPGTAQRYADAITSFVTRKENDNGFGPTPRPQTKSGNLLDVTDLELLPELPPSVLFDQVDEEENLVIPGLIRHLTLWTDLVINVNTASEAVLRGLFRRNEEQASIGSDIYKHREDEADAYLTKENLKDLSTAERHKRLRDQEKQRAATGTTDPKSGAKSGGSGTGGSGSGEDDEDTGIYESIEDVKKNVPTVTETVFNEIATLITVKSSVFSIWVEAEMRGVRKMRHWVVRRNGAAFIVILAEPVNWPRLRPPDAADAALAEGR